jgi:hypothetical protein
LQYRGVIAYARRKQSVEPPRSFSNGPRSHKKALTHESPQPMWIWKKI